MKPLIVTASLSLVLNLTVSPALAHYLGFAGVLTGALIASGLVSLLLLVWTLSIAEFTIPLRQLFRVGGLTILAGLLPGIILTLVLHLGEQPLGWLKLVFVGAIASGAFVVLSLAQADYRRMILRVLYQVREGIRFGWSKRNLSNA
jgi:hypothetical protein